MQIVSTIIPIFVIIFIGWFAHYRRFIPESFLAPANRIVFYLAIPAMIFKAISGASFSRSFDVCVLVIALLSSTAGYVLGYLFGRVLKLRNGSLGSFIQTSSHCNIGYIGFAVVYYYLGNEGLAKAGMFAGFVLILQNFYSVVALAIWSDRKTGTSSVRHNIIAQVILNPTILAAGLGIIFSIAEIPLPLFVSRSLDILGGMALPTALLIIGASLSPGLIRIKFSAAMASSVIKLVVLPAIALGLFAAWDIPGTHRLPIVIMLAAPSATTSYIMAGEMGGDTRLAAAGVSLCTMLSLFSYLFWLHMT